MTLDGSLSAGLPETLHGQPDAFKRVGVEMAVHSRPARGIGRRVSSAGFSIYRIGYLHEGSIDFSNPQGLIYSALLSPSANAVIPGQAIRWPWQVFALVIAKMIHRPEINVLVNLTLGIGFLIAFIIAWKYLNIADRLYSLVIILVSLSATTVDLAYVSLPRHLFLAIPVFIGLAAAIRKPWQKRFLISLQIPVMLFLLLISIFVQWIP
jgi:hypothetical protein